MDNNSYDSDETQEPEPLYMSNGLNIGLNKYDFTAFLLNMLFIDQVHDFRSTAMRAGVAIPVPPGFEDDKLTAFHQTKCMLYGTMCIMANGQQDELLHHLYIALFKTINNPFEMMKEGIAHNNMSEWDGNWNDMMEEYEGNPFYGDNFFNIDRKNDDIYRKHYKNWNNYTLEGEVGDGHYYRYYHSLIFTNQDWINRLYGIKDKLKVYLQTAGISKVCKIDFIGIVNFIEEQSKDSYVKSSLNLDLIVS